MINEWRQLYEDKESLGNLLGLVREIILHNMKHNAEVEACDLLIEIEQLPLLLEYVEEVSHSRVCIYLLRFRFFNFLLEIDLRYVALFFTSCVC